MQTQIAGMLFLFAVGMIGVMIVAAVEKLHDMLMEWRERRR